MAEKMNDKDEWTEITLRVPPELKSYGPSLIRFFDAMIYKLRRNAHKGKWEEVPIDRALAGVVTESAELDRAVKYGSTTEVLMEGADVANQALIVAEVALEARHAVW